MRRFVLTVGVILIGVSAAALAPEIEPDRLLAHIKFLSSDELKGRGNGSPELDRAADYIAEAFKDAGLAARRGQRLLVPAIRARRPGSPSARRTA